MIRVRGAATDSTGAPVAGVSITVNKAGTSTPVSLYSDDGITTLSNPFTNDSNGTFEFYTPSERIDIVPSKAGITVVASDWTDILAFDPLDYDAWHAPFFFDAMSAFLSGSDLLLDGARLVKAGTAQLKTPTTTYKNGWLEILGDGSAAPKVMQANGAGAFYAPFVITADPLIFDCRIERVTATAATLRIGLGSADLSAGDPAHGFYIRQIDSNNAFLVVRSGGADSGVVDLGVTLASMRRIRIHAANSGIRAFVDGVAKTAVTSSIPSSQMLGFSAASSAATSGVGLAIDYVRIWSRR